MLPLSRTSLRFSRSILLASFSLLSLAVSHAAESVTNVFILAGQSNMQGHGVIEFDHPEHYNSGKGNLLWAMKHSESKEQMTHLRNASGFWTTRNDVTLRYKHDGHVRKGPLTVGYTPYGGKSHIGPELQFGHIVGDAIENPVLLIKTAWGGKSLYTDFRPPSSGGTVGPYYKKMVEEVREALSELKQPYVISGFVWMQGWNDMTDNEATNEYEKNLIHLIEDIRSEFNRPELPVIVGELGNMGTNADSTIKAFRKAQRNGTRKTQNSIFVETQSFARDPKDSPNIGHGHHWYGNAESYFLIGDALGKSYLKLTRSTTTAKNGYRVLISTEGVEIEARIIEFKNDAVTFIKSNGQRFDAVPISRFSESSQNDIRSTWQKKIEEPTPYEIKQGTIAGYGHISTNQVDSATYDGGFSMYSAVWPLVEHYPGNQYQTGLLHTWMFAKYSPDVDTTDMYSTIEGGLGWWRDTCFATETPKFIMGGVALNFSAWANGPGAGQGRDWDHPKGNYAIAQLSSRVIWPPDGLNLKQGTCGELFGYGYRPLPLLEAKDTTYGHPVPTGDQCWTLFVNTENVKGPLTFFLPEFFSKPSIKTTKMAGQFLDSRPANPNRSLSMETQYIPAFIAEDDKGNLYSRIATILYPKTGKETVIAHQVTAYEKDSFWSAMERWFDKGDKPSERAFEQDSKIHTFNGDGGSSWSIYTNGAPKDEHYQIDWDVFQKNRAYDKESFGYEWNKDFVVEQPYKAGTAYKLPEYYRLESTPQNKRWVPVSKEKVPTETGLHTVQLPKAENRIMEPYVTPDAPDSVWKSPGPVSGPHKAYPGDGSVVTYYWYRFADQPSIQHADLTKIEREELQRRVELIHREWSINQTFIHEPTTKTPLAMIDPALVVEPPTGYEIGYVPIATRQEWAPKK